MFSGRVGFFRQQDSEQVGGTPLNSVSFGTTSAVGWRGDITTVVSTLPTSTTGITVSTWIKPLLTDRPSGTFWAPITLRVVSGNQFGLRFVVFNNGDLGITRSNSAGTSIAIDNFVTNAFPTKNQWYHVALTINTASQSAQCYINGVQRSTGGTISSDPIFWGTLYRVFVGGPATNNQAGYGDALTQLWIDDSYIDLSTNISKFYNNGYVPLGPNGIRSGLPQPMMYNNGSTNSPITFFTNGGRTTGSALTYNFLNTGSGVVVNGT
jgi:hypothetical protein